MQSKFTQRKLLYSSVRAVMFLLFFTVFNNLISAQVLSGQRNKAVDSKVKKDLVQRTTSAPSLGRAPVQSSSALRLDPIQSDAGSPFSSAFAYNGAGPFQLNKQSLLNTTLTPIGATVSFVFPGAAAWVTTTQKMYVIDQGAPFALYMVDTLSGIRTLVANCTGVPFANFTGLTWDISTNTMYGVATDITASQIFTVNITTGVCTPIGSPTTVSPGAIQLNAAPGGSLFSTDIVNDQLHKWNKTTGVPTSIGPLGFDTNFGMDGHFDISDGQYFWAAFNNTVGQAQLRIIDTLTGSSTLVGAYSGQVETLAIYPVPQSPCTGTPAPGNTTSTPNPVCTGASFVLAPENFTIGSGVTYQWQSSPDGSTWTNIVGANSASLVRQQIVATYYRVSVTCAGNTVFTTPLQVTMAPLSSCYCVPTYANGCALGDFIARVRLGTLDNTTTCSTPPYTYYSALAAPVVIRGATNQLIVTVGPDTFGQFVAVWADLNQDGDFSDAGEFLAPPVNAGAGGTVTINITIPATALLGETRLRIRGGDDAAPTAGQSCGASNSSFGEAEDYDIMIEPCIQGVITSHPSNTSAQCSGTTTFSVGATGSGLTWQWEQRVNSSSPWTLVTNGTNFSGATTNTLTVQNTPSSFNGYQYRAIMSGACTAPDFSNAATLTVTPLIATVTPTSATICSGQVQNIRLTNVSAPVQVFNEGFDVVSPLPAGWAQNNRSNPLGPNNWMQGNTTVFNSHSGAGDSYAAANWASTTTTGVGTISNWLFTPQVELKNGNILTFWTRKVAPDAFPDRLQVRMSTSGASVNVGATETSVGDFTTLLLDINPTLIPGVYPLDWQLFTITLSGIPAPIQGRFAFRYFVTNGGGAGSNSDFIGIDDAVYTAGAEALGVWTASPAAPNTMFNDAGVGSPYVAGTPVNGIYVNPTVTTTYTVVYSTTNPACTSQPTSVTVFVEKPVGAITQPTNKSACLNGSTTFTASAVGGPFTYQWQVSTNGGASFTDISGATSQNLTLNGITQIMNNNQYRVRFTAAACASTATSNAATLTVNPLPIVTISAPLTALTPGQQTTITATSTPGAGSPTSWTWFYNGVQVVTTPPTNTNTLTTNIDGIGTYQARVTDVNGCVSVSNELVIGSQASERLWIYPNPTKGQFQVRVYFDGPNADFREVMIYNDKGQLVARKAFELYITQPPYLQMDFDMTHLPAGTYVVKVEERYTGKIKSGILVKVN